MPHPDLAPATLALAAVVAAVPDDALGDPTPCGDWTVGDLLDHVCMLAEAFTASAAKDLDGPTSGPPTSDAAHLPTDWRSEIARRLGTMTEAWRPADAWTGMTRIGGVDLPGDVCGLTGLDEVLVHGWDLAVATGQRYETDDALVAAILPVVEQFATPAGAGADHPGPFGPQIGVADDAPLFERVLAMTGRDVTWTPRAAAR